MNVYTKFNGNWCKSCWSAWVPSKVEDQWIHIYWATPAWWKIHSHYTIKKKKKQWRKRLQIISLHICGEESSNIYKTHCWIWQISKGELDEFFWKLIRWGVNDECGQREKTQKIDGAHLDTVSFCQDVPECVLKLGEIHLMASSQQRLGWTGTNQTEYFLNDAWTTTS